MNPTPNLTSILQINHSRKYSKSPDVVPISELYTHKKDSISPQQTTTKRPKPHISPSSGLPSIPSSHHFKGYSSYYPLKNILRRFKSPQIEVKFSSPNQKSKKCLDLSTEQRTYVSPTLRNKKSFRTNSETPGPVLLRRIEPEIEVLSIRNKQKELKEKQVNENPYIKKLGFLIGCYKETQQRKSYLNREMIQRQSNLDRSFRREESPVSEIEGIPISFTPLPDILSLLPNSVI